MSVQPRPTDTITVDFLQLGQPYIEFAPSLGSGAFGPFRSLGVVDSSEIAKTIELVTLRSSQSGVSVKLRELVRLFEAQLNVGIFQHSGENMQLMFASSTLVDISADPAASVVGDAFVLTDDNEDFLDLANQLIDESTVVVTADLITLENVGTGDGVLGPTTGDFALDFKPLLIADITLYQETSALGVVVDRTADLVSGSTPMTTEIAIEIGATAASGDITYFAGEAPPVGTLIEVTYEPSHATVLNTDFTVDPKPGRVRLLDFETTTPNTEPFRQFQPMEADYDHNQIDHDEIQPFTQFTFAGQTRVRLLTDVGINIIWVVPSTRVRPTDYAFVFNSEEFQVTQLTIDLLDAGGTSRFGTMEIYPETP